jgi:hypothetical protein
MPAASYNFSIEQGSDLEVVFQYIDENNTFVNLTNYYILLKFIADTGQIYTFDNITDTTNYQMITDNSGRIILNIPARITNTYDFSSANYDLDIQEPNEQYPGSGLKRYRFAQGTVSIIKRNIPITIQDVADPMNRPAPDACAINCSSFESAIYSGSGIQIRDNTSTVSSVSVSDSRPINYVELAINGLKHPSPQDLSVFLAPPSGDKILLFANTKISNYTPGFSFVLSDRALPNTSLKTVKNGGMCKIIDKTNLTRFNNSIPILICDNNGCTESSVPISTNSSGISIGGLNNENLLSSFSSLRGYVPSSGDWTLHVQDNDIGGSGIIDAWKLIITYVDLES